MQDSDKEGYGYAGEMIGISVWVGQGEGEEKGK